MREIEVSITKLEKVYISDYEYKQIAVSVLKEIAGWHNHDASDESCSYFVNQDDNGLYKRQNRRGSHYWTVTTFVRDATAMDQAVYRILEAINSAQVGEGNVSIHV